MTSAYQDNLRDVLRKRLGGDRRVELLDATAAVLIERGFDQTRYADIATASGASVGTLQHYFGSLENLLIEACLHTCDADFARTMDIAGTIGPPWDRLLWVVKMSLACDRPGVAWQVRIEFWHAAVSRPFLRETVSRMQSDWRGLLGEAIRYGVSAGTFAVQRDIEQMAWHIAATCHGTVFPVWMDNPDFDVRAFESYLVADLAAALGSRPEGFTNLDDIERQYRGPH